MYINHIEAIIKSNIPLLLEGPTGCGKTYLVQELANKYNKTLHVVDVSGELTIDQLFSATKLRAGTTYEQDGAIVPAMRSGDWVMFNELNTALPEVLTILNGLLDDQRAVTLPSGERVQAHPDFRFIGTQNPSSSDYSGTNQLNKALLNRMIKITMDYMSIEDEIKALSKHTKLSDSTLTKLVYVARHTRQHFDEPLSTRDLKHALDLKEKSGMAYRDAMSLICESKYSRDEYFALMDVERDVLNRLKDITGDEDTDPLKALEEKWAVYKQARDDLLKEKADIRKAVKADLLKELMGADNE